jgi:hypothetical protein
MAMMQTRKEASPLEILFGIREYIVLIWVAFRSPDCSNRKPNQSNYGPNRGDSRASRDAIEFPSTGMETRPQGISLFDKGRVPPLRWECTGVCFNRGIYVSTPRWRVLGRIVGGCYLED